MNWKNTTARYGTLSIAMHWLMVMLLVGVYGCIELRELFPKGSDSREALKGWHFSLGLTVFILVWFRLSLRLVSTIPRIDPEPEPWQGHLAKAVHICLYLLMFTMPVLGWLILSAEAKAISFYGLQLPALISENNELGEFIKEIHVIGGTAGYFLVGIHAIAALFHHYVKRDNTLLRIMPVKSK